VSFFNEVMSGVGNVLGQAATYAAPLVQYLPGLGGPAASVLSAYGAVSDVLQDPVDNPGGSKPPGPGAHPRSLWQSKFLGIPLWVGVPVVVGGVFLLRRRRK